MANKFETHHEILCAQVGTLFAYCRRSNLPITLIESFEPLVVDGRPIISYLVEKDPEASAKRTATIKVVVEDRVFKFFNNYSYGVPLGGGIIYDNSKTPEKDLIDIEYALSIATEHLASQISKHLE